MCVVVGQVRRSAQKSFTRAVFLTRALYPLDVGNVEQRQLWMEHAFYVNDAER